MVIAVATVMMVNDDDCNGYDNHEDVAGDDCNGYDNHEDVDDDIYNINDDNPLPLALQMYCVVFVS